MSRALLRILLLSLLLAPPARLSADTIVTSDGMVLNGKVTGQESTTHVTIITIHGTFTIERTRIREIRMETVEGPDGRDREGSGKMDGAGKKDREGGGTGEQTAGREARSVPLMDFNLFLAPVYAFNNGSMGWDVGYGFGGVIYRGIAPEFSSFLDRGRISGIRFDIFYLQSVHGERTVKGSRFSAGPLWYIPLSMLGKGFTLMVSPDAGIGWYVIERAAREPSAFMWNLGCIAGPSFSAGSLQITPRLRVEYIHHPGLPLLGYGLGVSIGYRFSAAGY